MSGHTERRDAIAAFWSRGMLRRSTMRLAVGLARWAFTGSARTSSKSSMGATRRAGPAAAADRGTALGQGFSLIRSVAVGMSGPRQNFLFAFHFVLK